MKQAVASLRLRLRFHAGSKTEAIERMASELEQIIAYLREAQPGLSIRRLPFDYQPGVVTQYIGEYDFHWKGPET